MDIKKLLKKINYVSVHGNPVGDIKGIAYDSRKVQKDYLFVAIPGEKDDGIRYENEAVKRGAVAIVAKSYNPSFENILQIVVEQPRIALSILSREFYNNPGSKLFVVGVTGTNGKTTTTYLIESLLNSVNRKPIVIGTVNYRFMDRQLKALNTTPESLDLYTMMNEYLSQGATDAVMEVSSHALSQGRVNGIDFDVAIFTNLTQDHLDYHKTMENYFAAKSILFEKLLVESHKTQKFAVLNSDDPWTNRLKIKRGIHILRYGSSNRADIKLINATTSLDGIHVKLSTPIGTIELESPLVGYHNVYNIMASVATAIIANIPFEHIQQGIASMRSVPGRLEGIKNSKGVYVFVDYAHTPDALEKALLSLNELKKKRIICVFGCGGDRDKGKRPIMGEVATKLSDITIITSDNPRSEQPESIILDIEKGIKNTPKVEQTNINNHHDSRFYTVIQDRKEAIWKALDIAQKGDILLIAGKGHEDYQIFKDKTIHFSDKEAVNDYFGMVI
ncbi:MAG: UDP-N-acetylmuramoyl-L-alanyl-D-glutamate--2,6-diaminopimelate ligase [bacterium]